MSLLTTVLSLVKPAGTEAFTRSILNANNDIVDKQALALAVMGALGSPITLGALVKDVNGKPQSRTIAGPNGLTGSISWTFTATTITETMAITAPSAWSLTKTITLSDLSEVWTVS